MSEVIVMDVVISTLATFWLLLALSFVLIKRGLWIFNDVAKGLSMFMLEKALGPAIDFVSGRPGSSSSTWIIMVWFGPSLLRPSHSWVYG